MHKPNAVLFLPLIGKQIGFGHMSRCLTIARNIKQTSINIYFYLTNDVDCANFDTSDITFIKNVNQLAHCDLIISDQLDYHQDELMALKKQFNCQVISLDHTPSAQSAANKVINLVQHQKNTTSFEGEVLAGLEYAIINSKFQAVNKSTPISDTVKNVTIMFGGSDPSNKTLAALAFLDTLATPLNINVILGPLNNLLNAVKTCALTSKHNIKALHCPTNLPDIMASSDVAFCGCGTTLFEFSYLGIPSIVAAQNETEARFIKRIKQYEIMASDHFDCAWKALQAKTQRQLMRERQQKIFDGEGVKRILSACNLLKNSEQ